MFTNETIVCRSEDTVFTNLEDQVVMMDVDKGVYYGLNPVGTRIWELIEKPITIAEINKLLMDDFDVSLETCQEQTNAFIEQLLEYNVAKIVEGV